MLMFPASLVAQTTEEPNSIPPATPSEQLAHVLGVLESNDITVDIELRIRLTAIMYDVDQSLALNIACAESQFDADVKNKRSTASGVYQFLDSSWKYYGMKYWGSLKGRDKHNEADNIELAMMRIADVGTADWNASKYSGLGGGWLKKPYERGLCKKTVLV